MDYKDLADLIFPDAKPIEFYEEKYPERNLPEGAMVVRIGPSPTGSVHIGTIYQALIARTIADRTNGVFFMRVEDTDQKREVENGINDIIDSLKYFDVLPDEGMDTETTWHGEYGPYRQSMRKEIYQAYAKYLLEQGKAYPCFATAEELEEMRKTQEVAGVKPGYYGVWAKYRNLTVEEAAEKIKNGEHYIIRLRSNGSEERKIKVHDVIKGNVIFPENDQDIVIIKADGLPTYHFAHAVDDHLMHTTHVIRGDEWLSSVPIHVQLFQMLGFKAPKYAHTATILKNDNGNSLCEEEKTGLALEAMEKAKQKGVKLLLPVDTKVGKEFKPDTESKTVAWTDIPDGWEGFDIGEKTIEMFKNELKNAKTVIWNGPVGLFEFDQFAIGTNEIAKTLADLDATTIIGGGDSGAAVAKAGLADKMTHICTGGGASLEFLEGKKLPGIECLLDK